ncbi:outer membrane lipoprotein carrier protein LolA [bacterium]|nr:outer membrane lipoprotein carrier protein LolA [candidate division CSSED10-310 bacterium]
MNRSFLTYFICIAWICLIGYASNAIETANVLGLSNSPHAEKAAILDQFLAFIQQIDRLSADFMQENNNVSTGQIMTGSGILRIQRPDRFEWVYSSQPRNHIVCNGSLIIMILPDVQQVMMDSADSQEILWSPLSLLTDARWMQRMQVETLTPDSTDVAETASFKLTPRKQEDAFENIIVRIPLHLPATSFEITVFDGAGNQNRIRFTGLRQTEPEYDIDAPSIPVGFEVTDFQGNPRNPEAVERKQDHED